MVAPMPSSLVLFALSFGVLLTFVLLLWAINAIKARLIMSRQPSEAAPDRGVADRLPATATTDGQGIAKPGNAVNDPLTGKMLPEEVRNEIRFWAKVEAVAELVSAGKAPQTEAIEIVFGCKRSGRPDSPYGRARAAVAERVTQAQKYRPLTPEQQATRQALGL